MLGSSTWLFALQVVFGCGIAIVDQVWLPTMAAVSADVILSPEELRDPKLVDVVYRTHTYRDDQTLAGVFALPYRALGALTMLSGAVGLFLTYRTPTQAKTSPIRGD